MDTIEIDVTVIDTEKIVKGKWQGITNTTKPFKAETRIAAESEFMALHKVLSFFEIEQSRIKSKVPNNLGGYTYTLSEQ